MVNDTLTVEVFDSRNASNAEENAAAAMSAFAHAVLLPLFGVDATLNACLSAFAATIAYCDKRPKDGAEALRATAETLPDVVAAIRVYDAPAANDADHPS